jgi:hypothetical protein
MLKKKHFFYLDIKKLTMIIITIIYNKRKMVTLIKNSTQLSLEKQFFELHEKIKFIMKFQEDIKNSPYTEKEKKEIIMGIHKEKVLKVHQQIQLSQRLKDEFGVDIVSQLYP